MSAPLVQSSQPGRAAISVRERLCRINQAGERLHRIGQSDEQLYRISQADEQLRRIGRPDRGERSSQGPSTSRVSTD